MNKGRVVGTATATVKHPTLQGWKLLVVQLLAENDLPKGDPVLAVDALGAGIGEIVIMTSDGKSTRELLGDNTTPARWSVIGLPD